MVANQIHTVEPGLYFIPSLLDKVRGGEHAAKFNWSRVDEFIPFGGIRIEDNIVVHQDGRLENLTRDAFAEIE
jgi:Xaa-Pro dipeptidase